MSEDKKIEYNKILNLLLFRKTNNYNWRIKTLKYISILMAVKEWIVQLKPVQLYIIMFTTSIFFIVEMTASYITHSLTLLLHSYYMLCNIIAFIGYIASSKASIIYIL